MFESYHKCFLCLALSVRSVLMEKVEKWVQRASQLERSVSRDSDPNATTDASLSCIKAKGAEQSEKSARFSLNTDPDSTWTHLGPHGGAFPPEQRGLGWSKKLGAQSQEISASEQTSSKIASRPRRTKRVLDDLR